MSTPMSLVVGKSEYECKERMIISTSSTPPTIQYYYPRVEEFPFDTVCRKIVLALQARDWIFPGIKILVSDLQDDNITYRRIHTIESNDFRLLFRRKQSGKIGQYEDYAAITTINIPEKELSVFDDALGLDFYVYVGKDWSIDKKSFVHGIKFQEKNLSKSRTYLNYQGSCTKPNEAESTDSSGVKPYLVANDDEDEYAPQGEEPKYYETAKVFQEFTTYLEKNVLEKLQQNPVDSNIVSLSQKVQKMHVT